MVYVQLKWLEWPFFQLLFFVLLTVPCILAMAETHNEEAWMIAGLIYTCFILLNSALICAAGKPWKYFLLSMACSILYLLLMAILVPALSKLIDLQGPEENAMIFLVTLYHPVALLVMSGLKWAYLRISTGGA